jgi:hypothetical protein
MLFLNFPISGAIVRIPKPIAKRPMTAMARDTTYSASAMAMVIEKAPSRIEAIP